MDWLVKELRESSESSIVIGSSGPGINSITFDTPQENGIQYYVTSGQLIREYPVGTMRAIANNITALNYAPGSPTTTLTITLTASTTAIKRPTSIQLVEKISLRN
ncbi:MAG: hypothetical protein P9M12_04470 [Candidatus Aceula lacicola]|nr:hypothetical protein [Candidatus Aceula lacicola]